MLPAEELPRPVVQGAKPAVRRTRKKARLCKWSRPCAAVPLDPTADRKLLRCEISWWSINSMLDTWLSGVEYTIEDRTMIRRELYMYTERSKNDDHERDILAVSARPDDRWYQLYQQGHYDRISGFRPFGYASTTHRMKKLRWYPLCNTLVHVKVRCTLYRTAVTTW